MIMAALQLLTKINSTSTIGNIILQGPQQPTKLWTINNLPAHSLNVAVDTPTIVNHIKSYHASFFSPALETLRKAIKAG